MSLKLKQLSQNQQHGQLNNGQQHKYIRLYMDDDITTIIQQLDYHIFGIKSPTSTTTTTKDTAAKTTTSSSINPLLSPQIIDNDWKNFSFPF